MSMRTKLAVISTLLASSASFAAPGYNNPASVNYVNNAINTAITNVVTYFNNAIAQSTVVAGEGLTKSGNTLSVNPFYKIGDLAQGGIVFFIDETGQHGFVAALTDTRNYPVSTGSYDILWWPPAATAQPRYLSTPVQTGAISYGLGNGAPMTNLIIAAATRAGGTFTLAGGNYNYAAALAYEVADDTDVTENCNGNYNCVGGWYLPDQTELLLAIQNLCNVSATDFVPFVASTGYWTSKQNSANANLVVKVTTNSTACAGIPSFVSIGTGNTPSAAARARVRQIRQF